MASIWSGVPQGFILGLFLFLIYANDLPNGLKIQCNLFDDDTSLFSVAHNVNTSPIHQQRLNINKPLDTWVGNEF